MGYYTDYEITITHGKVNEDKLHEDFYEITGEVFNELYNIKWYSYKKDMQTLSKLYPDVMFYIEGKGEEEGDLWHAYCCNGDYKEEHAVITYPDINYHTVGDFAKRCPELLI